MTFWVLLGVLRPHLDDLRESLKQGRIYAEKLTFQGDPIIGQVEGKLVVRGALKHLANRLLRLRS